MFRKAIATILVLGMSCVINAGDGLRQISEESEVFVGVELGGTFIQGDTGGLLGELNHEGGGVSIGVRLGAQNDLWRSMVIADYFDSDDDDQNYERIMIQVDYFIMTSSFSTTAFRPYIGLNGGYLNYESTKIDESGFTYGAQVGFTTAVTNNIDFDLSVRYSLAAPDELDHIGNIAFAINYLY